MLRSRTIIPPKQIINFLIEIGLCSLRSRSLNSKSPYYAFQALSSLIVYLSRIIPLLAPVLSGVRLRTPILCLRPISAPHVRHDLAHLSASIAGRATRVVSAAFRSSENA